MSVAGSVPSAVDRRVSRDGLLFFKGAQGCVFIRGRKEAKQTKE